MARFSKFFQSLNDHFSLFGIRGVAHRAMAEVPGSKRLFNVKLCGAGDGPLIRLGTTDAATYEHVFVKDEYGFVLRHASTIIDVGANVGLSAVYFSRKYKTARIIAIESEPENFAVLQKNAKLFPNIVPIHAGLWNRNGLLSIRDGGAGHWGKQVSSSISHSDIVVPSMTLSTLISKHSIECIDLLKIDAEGAEVEILEDYKSWIDLVQVICCELHDRFKPGCSRAFESATAGFPVKWRRGELYCAARCGALISQ